jgi:hypothetical protein
MFRKLMVLVLIFAAVGVMCIPYVQAASLQEIETTIEGYYQTILLRASDAAGKKNWVDQAVRGMSFENIKKAFYNSPEFKALAEKTIEGFYKSILGRAPEASGKKYWVDIAIKGASFADIKKGFYNSVEFRGIADKTIEGFYKSILGRSSDAGGKKFWVEKAVGGMSFKDIKKAFYASEEYKKSQKSKVKMTSDMRTGSSTILPK